MSITSLDEGILYVDPTPFAPDVISVKTPATIKDIINLQNNLQVWMDEISENLNGMKKELTRLSAVIKTNQSVKGRQDQCLFCQKHSDSSACRNFPTKDRRLSRVVELKLCLSCLHSHPTSGTCKGNSGCNRCHNRHLHTAICSCNESNTSKRHYVKDV